jgi:hypothetical protein
MDSRIKSASDVNILNLNKNVMRGLDPRIHAWDTAYFSVSNKRIHILARGSSDEK